MNAAGTKRSCLRCKPITRVVFAYIIRINYKGCALRVSVFIVLYFVPTCLSCSCARRVSVSRGDACCTAHGNGSTFPAIFSGDLARVQLLRGP